MYRGLRVSSTDRLLVVEPKKSMSSFSHGIVYTPRIHHDAIWRWPLFVLSVVYRMHCSEHDQYARVSVGSQSEVIRDLLLNGVWDARLLDFDIQTLITESTKDRTTHGFSTPPHDHVLENDAFQLLWGIGGLWFMVGAPYPSYNNSTLTPRFDASTFTFPIIGSELSYELFETLFLKDGGYERRR